MDEQYLTAVNVYNPKDIFISGQKISHIFYVSYIVADTFTMFYLFLKNASFSFKKRDVLKQIQLNFILNKQLEVYLLD